MSRKTAALAPLAVLLLAGCGQASMRIQVDVYKGSLANTEEIQKQQLASILNSADEALLDINGQLLNSMCILQCRDKHLPVQMPVYQHGVRVKLPNLDEFKCNFEVQSDLWATGSGRPRWTDAELSHICPVYLRMHTQVSAIYEKICATGIGQGARYSRCKPEAYDDFLDWPEGAAALRKINAIADRVVVDDNFCRSASDELACQQDVDALARRTQQIFAKANVVLWRRNELSSTSAEVIERSLSAEIAELSRLMTASKGQLGATQKTVGDLLSSPRYELAGLATQFGEQFTSAGKVARALHMMQVGQSALCATKLGALVTGPELGVALQQANSIVSGYKPAAENKEMRLLVDLAALEASQKDSKARFYVAPDFFTVASLPAARHHFATHRDSAKALVDTTEALAAMVKAAANAQEAFAAQMKRFGEAKTRLQEVIQPIADEADSEKKKALTAQRIGQIGKEIQTLVDAIQTAAAAGAPHVKIDAKVAAVVAQADRLANGDDVVDINSKLQIQSLVAGDFVVDPAPINKQIAAVTQNKKTADKELGDLITAVKKIRNELGVAVQSLVNRGVSGDDLRLRAELVQSRANLAEQSAAYDSFLRALQQQQKRDRRLKGEHADIAYGKIGGLATDFRILAGYLSYQIASVEPKSKRLRIDAAKLANLAAEYANQLTSRANALALQAGDAQTPGVDRRVLSTGQYLRDTAPTAFVEIYDWMNAATNGDIPVEQRINMAKRLFDDDNWGNINEVYASGLGDTAMAFIRDDIGNWNLKSFANKPGELVGAFTDVTIELFERAALSGADPDLLRRANASLAGGGLSNELAAAQLVGSLDMQTIRNNVVSELDAVETQMNDEIAKIDEATVADLGVLAAYKETLVGTEDEQKEQLEKVIKPKERADSQAVAKQKMVAVARNFMSLVEALQRVAVAHGEQQSGASQ